MNGSRGDHYFYQSLLFFTRMVRMDADIRIIRAVQQGQTQAFAHLVRTYQDPLYHLAFRLTGSTADAEDLTQEAFLKAFQAIKSFDTGKRFFPWLFTIALNVVRNHLKKEGPRPVAEVGSLTAHQEGEPETCPESGLIEQEELQRLEKALALLPLDQREAVIMRYYLDLPYDQLAEALDISVGAAKMRVRRGLENLRRLVGEAAS